MEPICENKNLPARLHDLVENCQWEKYKDSGSGDVVHVQKGSSCKARRPLLITGSLKLNCAQVIQLLFDKAELLPQWNPKVVTCKVLKRIDQNADIAYHLVKGYTGLVSPREFVTQREVGTVSSENGLQKNIQIFAIQFTDSVDYPKTPGVVRGEQGLGGWMLYENGENQSDFKWLVDLDIKLSPWIPYKLLENRLINQYINTVDNLRKYLSLH